MTDSRLPHTCTFDHCDISAFCQPSAAAAGPESEAPLPNTRMTLRLYHDLVFAALRPYRQAYDDANEALRRWYQTHEPPHGQPG